MQLEYQILLAVTLDLLLGDPRWFPHPVRLIGRFALFLEQPLRRGFHSARSAGICAAAVVVGAAACVTYALVRVSGHLHPWFGDAMSILVMYTGLAARDLLRHSTEVWRALEAEDLVEARVRVGMICGRDTDRLDESGTARATVESVAENMVDGVTAPLFWAAVGGPVGIMAYKAVSTLDSTFGYKNERYREFGWASARLDDLAAFVPSRLTAIFVPVAALILGLRPMSSVRIFLRDRNKHPSPNAGQSEAAVAGALGVQLGGTSFYEGVPSHKEYLGDPIEPLTAAQIRATNALMVTTGLLVLAALIGLRILLFHAADLYR
ncbi:MAG: cobalamin biosynthesis protein CobD [Desulfomonile tiedjei]|nr:cobalamin biosynthesis protein CobD [Desulfomonile tiedjei]